ncbi:hypothetical protein FGG08_007613 [Glutinoglossum americanum]|uniref:THIF-type NAD/FAD binding fold domain-containing protein n=1 Tax=Glutinoglossum americanum TaxID=1670608 RepID=A0A9P8HVX4_9PEZI|nr:hypothetical protein FGG08_007613 [Glutinoglossum americanum]
MAADSPATASALRTRIHALESQLSHLKHQLARAEEQTTTTTTTTTNDTPLPLAQEEYARYSRQMLVPAVGLQGQLLLSRSSSVLIVGLGGLGCPAAAYLAGAGVGTIGLVDGDAVEVSNLHRQVLHSAGRVGWGKVESAVEALRA